MRKTILLNIMYVFWFLFFWYASALIFSIFIDYPVALRTTAGIYIATLLLTLTPIAEGWFRFSNAIQPMVMKDDLEKVQPIFMEVFESARKISPSLSSNISLYVVGRMAKGEREKNAELDSSFNAFSIGWTTLALTKDLIRGFPEHVLGGVIAHELGHFASYDSIGLQFQATGNFLFTLLYRAILVVANIIHKYFTYFRGTKMFYYLFQPIVWVFKLIMFVGNLILSPLSRKIEYNADKFAFDCGYGEELLSFLKTLYSMFGDEQGGFKGFLENTHPHLQERIARLEGYLDNYEPDITQNFYESEGVKSTVVTAEKVVERIAVIEVSAVEENGEYTRVRRANKVKEKPKQSTEFLSKCLVLTAVLIVGVFLGIPLNSMFHKNVAGRTDTYSNPKSTATIASTPRNASPLPTRGNLSTIAVTQAPKDNSAILVETGRQDYNIIGTVLITHTRSVNVRAGGSTDYEQIDEVFPNQEFPCVGIAQSGWYRIILPDGRVGYLSNNLAVLTVNNITLKK